MEQSRWQEFDETLKELSGRAPYKLRDGSEWVDNKHGPVFYHDPPIYLEEDFEAHVLSDGGEVPSSLSGSAAPRNQCEGWDDVVEGIKSHECMFGQYIPFDEPRRLCLGYMCSQCGETWMLRIRSIRSSQSEPIPNLLKVLRHPLGRRQVGIFLKDGENSSNLVEGWGAFLAGKTDKLPGENVEAQENPE